MRLAVKYRGTEHLLAISPLAVIGWEKFSGRRLTDMADGLGMTDLVVLAYEQARLQALTDAPDYMAFAADLEDIEPPPDPPLAAVPPEGAASSDSTSNSPPP